MPTRLTVPSPEPSEELRQLAEAIADLHYVVGTILEGGKELIPGESFDELTAAWASSQQSMSALVQSLISSPPAINHSVLEEGELTGEVGKIKRANLGRLKERFLMYWNSEPRTDEKRAKSADAASDYLELGATVIGSIPGYERVKEIVSLVKQLLGARAKRGL